jgi:hypothetical protein
MIKCRKCEFEVSYGMKYALQKNLCPCCGSALLGDSQKVRIDILKSKILEQEFSQKLDKDIIFDISLFILTEFFPAKQVVKSETEEDSTIVTEDGDDGDFEFSEEPVMPSPPKRSISPRSSPKPTIERRAAPTLHLEDEEEHDDEYAAIRREVRSEIVEDDDEDDDLDLKIARLKRVAAETKIGKSGAMVRRLSD